MKQKKTSQITLAITGASGAVYAMSLLLQLVKHYQQVHLMISDAGRLVLSTEMDIQLPKSPAKIQQVLTDYCNVHCKNHNDCDADIIQVYAADNWYAPVASGSSAPKQMVVCPASMGCISAIATGASNSLIERAADVLIKEKGQLIVLPREMPFSTIHLKNLLSLSEAGVTVMPASPGFYAKPENINDLVNFVVARVLNHLGIDNQLSQAWGYEK